MARTKQAAARKKKVTAAAAAAAAGGGNGGGGSAKKKLTATISKAAKANKAVAKKKQSVKHNPKPKAKPVKRGRSSFSSSSSPDGNHPNKKKRNSSDYGPISNYGLPQQPKGQPWNLRSGVVEEDMRRQAAIQTKALRNQRKLAAASTARQATGQKPKKNNKGNQFVLKMPLVSRNDRPAPWLSVKKSQQEEEEEDTKPSSPNHHNNHNKNNTLRSPTILKVLSVPEASLDILHDELEKFASYVQLNGKEIGSRRSVVRAIQQQCQKCFGVPPESCQVFGSFASLPVCTFHSDIDLAIYNVVPPDPIHSSSGVARMPSTTSSSGRRRMNHGGGGDDEDPEDEVSETRKMPAAAEPLPPHPNVKRQERVLKWKAALAEAEEKKQEEAVAAVEAGTSAETAIAIDVDQKVNGNVNVSVDVVTSSHFKKAPPRQELAECRPLSPSAAESNQDGFPLFVIDRLGCPDDKEEEDIHSGGSIAIAAPPQTATTVETTNTTDAPTVTDTSKEASVLDDDIDDIDDDGRSSFPADADGNQSARAEKVTCSNDNDDGRNNSNTKTNNDVDDDDDDSDADSADKLSALKDRQSNSSTFGHPHRSIRASLARAVEKNDNGEEDDDDEDEGEQDEQLKAEGGNRPRSRSIISLCSATTCSDTEEKEWDDSGMEVSFVSSARTLASRNQATGELAVVSFGPTGQTRTKVVKALGTLSRKLRAFAWTTQLYVRKWARVPIINMETKMGFECDVAIGGHNGTDTSSYASSQCERFKSFSTVVLVLKILLNQHDLDKPFSGGLGSFKLYVLVARHIEQHLQLGGNDNAAEVFLAFLLRYGDAPFKFDSSYARFRTTLRSDSVVETEEGEGFARGMADMGGVSRLNSCLKVFHECYSTLREKLQNIPSNKQSASILSHIIDSAWLRKKRQKDFTSLYTPPAAPAAPSNSFEYPAGLPIHSSWAENHLAPHQRTSNAQKQTANGGAKRKAEEMFKTDRNMIGGNKFGQKPASHQVESLDTDDEAEQLMARYGIQPPRHGEAQRSSSHRNANKSRRSTKKRTRRGDGK